MEHDFLEGIDEQFQRLMQQNGNGKRNGRSGRLSDDGVSGQIIDALHGLSRSQKEKVLAFVQSLKQKGD